MSKLAEVDPTVARIIDAELRRQQDQIELIASENIVSEAVLLAQGSVLTNKYAEGYPSRRYYGGCHNVDEIETLAIERAKQLFKCEFANVQPHSGAQANAAAFVALLNPGDVFLSLSLPDGGHLTHGSPVTISGRWFRPVHYGLTADDHRVDMDEVRRLALRHRPRMIIAGGSAYARVLDFEAFRDIADEVGAYLMVDMAHYAGLVAAGVYPSPIPYAHVTTTTTHKTLRGPRGGLILTRDPEIAKRINSAVFPGIQGGPLMHAIAAKAVGFEEALQPAFKLYASKVVHNAQVLAGVLSEGGLSIVSGGTDCHMVLVDLRPKSLTGKAAERALENAGLACNKNAIPCDPEKPSVTSGLRLGSPAATTRGFGADEFRAVGHMILDVLAGLANKGQANNGAVEAKVHNQVTALCRSFPIYPQHNVSVERQHELS